MSKPKIGTAEVIIFIAVLYCFIALCIQLSGESIIEEASTEEIERIIDHEVM